MLKLLATDLWTLLWTISSIRLMWESGSLPSTKICSALDVKSRLSRRRVLSQLETAALYSTHSVREEEEESPPQQFCAVADKDDIVAHLFVLHYNFHHLFIFA